MDLAMSKRTDKVYDFFKNYGLVSKNKDTANSE